MFCRKCGKEVKDGLKFCTNCGAPLNQTSNGINAGSNAGVSESSGTIDFRKNDNKKSVVPGSNRKKNKNKKILIVVSVIAGAVLAIALIIFALIYTGVISISIESNERQESSIDKDKKSGKSSKNKDDEEEETSKKSKKDKKKKEKSKKREESTQAATVPSTMQTVAATETMPTMPVVNNEFILPDSNIRVLSRFDLQGLTAEQCRLARNELYARHGRIFDDPNLQSYFQSKSWYYGTIPAANFSESMLNDIEIQNRNLIVEYEKEMGYTK